MGLENGTEQIVPGLVGGDAADVNSSVEDHPPHYINNTYADIVKSIEKKVKFAPSSHSFEIIQ